MEKNQFSNLDFGSKPTTVKLETIDVTINPELIINDFASAYLKELHRRNPEKFEAVKLTEVELQEYFATLIRFRVLSIQPDRWVDWFRAKALYIPVWIQFCMAQVGIVIDRDRGLKFRPVMDDLEYDMPKMLEISDKLQSFISDGVVLVKDAMPRGDEGDIETMSIALIEGYVMSQTKYSHPISSYVAAFLGFTLKREIDFKMLYRIRYDDVDFVRDMLLAEVSIR